MNAVLLPEGRLVLLPLPLGEGWGEGSAALAATRRMHRRQPLTQPLPRGERRQSKTFKGLNVEAMP